jgi:SulP family sulfate permease
MSWNWPLRSLRFIAGYMPGLTSLRQYQWAWLRWDIIAGLSVCALLIPQGMAYGSLAGVAPVNGLYAALAAMVTYSIFATSRHMMVGPESGTAVIAAGIVAPLAAGDPVRFAVLIAMLALLIGIILVFAGAIKLGFIADFLSRPVLVGYLNGVALTIIAGQLGKLFGIKLESSMFFPQLFELFTRLGQTSFITLGIGVAFIGLILLVKYRWPRVPAPLVVAVISILLVAVFSLDRLGVSILGQIPAGLPKFQFPVLSLQDIGLLVPGALSLAVLMLSDGLLTAQVFASRHGYRIDANREIIAFGMNNIAVSLFHGFPVSASESRTSVNDAARGRTQVSGLAASVFLIVALLWLTPVLSFLPYVALGAIVITAAVGLIDFKVVGELFSVRAVYGVLSLITTLGVLTIGLLPGIMVAVVFSLLHLLVNITRPHDAVLGGSDSVDGYHDIRANEDCKTLPGLIVYRFEASLIFVNAGYFRSRVESLLAAAEDPVKCIVIDAESMPGVDVTAAEMLKEFLVGLENKGIVVALARAKASVRKMLADTGVTDQIGQDKFFPSVRTAVDAFVSGRLEK